ncbi:MAG: hypothetical protein DMD74_08210 [Gemmatimonadetes bacterium]|nr:MAG: hypothetical protein DMD74_08210 [Gemmatimonadota bacterium]
MEATADVRDESVGPAAREAPTVRQPPVHSPLPWPALRAGGAALVPGRDPRPALHELLVREFAAEHVRLLASGTQALQVALIEAARDLRGDVIAALPAFTCFDVATAAVGAGVRIALYDVDPGTLSPDLDSLTAALTAGARLVVVTSLYGVPVQGAPQRGERKRRRPVAGGGGVGARRCAVGLRATRRLRPSGRAAVAGTGRDPLSGSRRATPPSAGSGRAALARVSRRAARGRRTAPSGTPAP